MTSDGSGPADGIGSTSEHATCLLVGEAGILIRGGSGSGKSTLARQLLDRTQAADRFGRLVSDDRVRIERRGGRLVARVAPPLAGLIEIRGLGLVGVAHEPAARLSLVVDCDAAPPRHPDAAQLWTEILGVRLGLVAVAQAGDPVGLVLWRLRVVDDTLVTGS